MDDIDHMPNPTSIVMELQAPTTSRGALAAMPDRYELFGNWHIESMHRCRLALGYRSAEPASTAQMLVEECQGTLPGQFGRRGVESRRRIVIETMLAECSVLPRKAWVRHDDLHVRQN